MLTFAEYEVDLDRYELRHQGATVPMEPKVFDVLAFLIQHRDRVVSKTELLDEIWGDQFVSESSVSTRVKTVRKLLGDSGREQRIVKTVHGRGFRFIASVEDASAVPEREPDDRATELDSTDFVLLLGAAGRARSEAMDEYLARAEAAGWLTAHAGAAGSGLRPYGAVLDLVDELLQREGALADALPHGCRTELDQVLSGGEVSLRQRLFVAVREVFVRAAEQRGVFVTIDDLQFADLETLSLIKQLGRLTKHHRITIVAAADAPCDVGDGVTTIEVGDVGAPEFQPLPPDVRTALQRIGLGGMAVDGVEAQAATGLDARGVDHVLRMAVAAGYCRESTIRNGAGGGFAFVTEDARQELLADLSGHARAVAHQEIADVLAERGGPPARIAAHYLESENPSAAVPFALATVRLASRRQALDEVLALTGLVVGHATGVELAELLLLRGDALVKSGDPSAMGVFRNALANASPDQVRPARIGMARAALVSGDVEAAVESLEGLDPDEGPHDGPLLLAKGMAAYYSGDLEAATRATDAARRFALEPGAPASLLDVITLEGLVAHNRGEWSNRLLREMRASKGSPELATTVFDSHLCVAEYLLYGPSPYAEVTELAKQLAEDAIRTGAQRAHAFAICLLGEAQLLAGDLDEAEQHLNRSLEMHRELGADTGTAHTLQRLAELDVALGEPARAERRAREALVLARWSPLSRHILQRTYGTLIAAAPDTESAILAAAEAADSLDEATACPFCQVMVSLPASMAYAEAGVLDWAELHLEMGRRSAALWEGTAWQGAVAEAESVLAAARGDDVEAAERLALAERLFSAAGHTLDADRCREAALA